MNDSRWTIQDVINSLPKPNFNPLATPHYTKGGVTANQRIMLAVSSMRDHTTNEGWELALALREHGYKLVGSKCPDYDMTSVPSILNILNPDVCVVQDKREWHTNPRDFRDQDAFFDRILSLMGRADIFTLTVLKDAHQRPEYHNESAREISCKGWIIYYNPRVVHHLAPYTRPQHLIRTYHSLDSTLVPPFNASPPENRLPAIISGAVSNAYPLRNRLIQELKYIHVLRHPGYHRRGSATPSYLQTLSKFRVSVCTASVYGYALRKIVESVACGCRVVTDLPHDEVLPEIDEALIRIHPGETSSSIWDKVWLAHKDYNPEREQHYAMKAQRYYDFRATGLRLSQDIETLRNSYCK